MKLTAVYLEPQNGYKTPLRSDTLWGILCWAIRSVYGKTALEKFIASYEGDNDNYVLSSCFPYTESNGKKTHYFPMPLLPPEYKPISCEGGYHEYVKQMTRKKNDKKNKFLTRADFQKVLNGEQPDKKAGQQVRVIPVTRNTINRLKGGTMKMPDGGQLFHVDEYHTKGLFFLAKGNTDMLKGALRYLHHVGLGGDRTVGKGWFKISFDDSFELSEPDDANACTTLSLYHPQEIEAREFKKDNTDILNYKIEMRGGRLGFFNYKQVQKDAIMMFEEGSVFPIYDTDKTQYGRNRIVLEPHPVHNPGLHHKVSHYGMGFMVKMKLPYRRL